MSEVHGLEYLFFVSVAARQVIGEKFDDVTRAQKRNVLRRHQALLEYEEHRQANKGDMMMPSSPTAHFILGHA